MEIRRWFHRYQMNFAPLFEMYGMSPRLFLCIALFLGLTCQTDPAWAQPAPSTPASPVTDPGVPGQEQPQAATESGTRSLLNPNGSAEAQTGRPSFATVFLQMISSLSYFSIPFAIATLLAIWFITERIVILRRGRVIPRPFVGRFLKLLEEGELTRDEALQICEENGSPVAAVFASGVRKWGKPSVEVEQAIIDGGEREVNVLRTHLRLINGIATISPLIGLLGTVWGMLESFDKIASAGAMGNTQELAGGIALALVTTAVGLLIAIPCLTAYMYLAGRIDYLVMEMDELGQRVVQSISAEGQAERAAKPRKTGESASKKAV